MNIKDQIIEILRTDLDARTSTIRLVKLLNGGEYAFAQHRETAIAAHELIAEGRLLKRAIGRRHNWVPAVPC